MREYILTEHEREILRTYFERGLKLEGFRILLFRIKKAHSQLKNDFELIERTLEGI